MQYHYVWLIWSIGFLLPWLALYVANPVQRSVMVKTSFATALLGLTEPMFVPAYWNPPSLFELARRTGFDMESLIFAFALGGIAAVLYNSVTHRTFRSLGLTARVARWHRLHVMALALPFVLFVPLYFLPWNPIYPGIVCLLIGALASVACRPELLRKTIVGGALFLALYGVFLLGLRWLTPGYIEQVWNLPALRGGLVGGIPLEELLFGLAFGMYWSGAYEHFAWRESVVFAFAPREH